MRIAYDMSSVIWTSLLVGKDAEGEEVLLNDKKVWVNSAEYGYENAVNMMLAPMREAGLVPSNMILVTEGMSSKKRRIAISPDYKGHRDSRPPEAYVEFSKCKDMLVQAFRDRGAIAVSQDLVEGDDTLAYLANNIEEDLIIVTNDNDMIVLNKTNAYGSKITVRVGGQVGVNKYGDFDLGLVTLYKALVGDSGDNIKGAKGFGPAAFLNIIGRYEEDGCWELVRLIETGNREELAVLAHDNECKFLQKIVDEWANVLVSYRLALLHPEWVETAKLQLNWLPGMAVATGTDERLRAFKGQHRLITSDNYAGAYEFLAKMLKETPFSSFDIETSTSDESSDWAAQAGVKVDVIGSYLVGFSITFGKNLQYTYYVSVAHAQTNNITMKQAREMIELMGTTVVHNMNFELPVLFLAEEGGTTWGEINADNGYHGFLPDCLDTQLESSYVDENMRLGLKLRSLTHLGYTQASFEEVTKLPGKPFQGGVEFEGKNEIPWTEYKMHELPATHVFSYGADDAMTTAALHNFYTLHMGLEHHYKVYLEVEIAAAYLHAQSFVSGFKVDVGKCKLLEREDGVTYDKAWETLREFLIAQGWNGTVPPVYVGQPLTAKSIKEAYAIVTGQDVVEEDDDDEDIEADDYVKVVEVVKDAVMSSKVRTPAKLIALISKEGQETLAEFLTEALTGNAENLQAYVLRHFRGEPVIKFSNKQMTKLLYETMNLPVRVRNKATKVMRAKGIKEGNPKADALAIAYAMRDASEEQKAVLEAIRLMQMVKTRRSLYYTKYPYFVHWKTGRIHSSHRQCFTNTRRASSSAPNMQQLPKHPKIEGQPARFREVVVPHTPNAAIVSMDFVSQELVVIAEYSQDANMLACFVGDNKKDMHALTGVGILQRQHKSDGWSYEMLKEVLDNPSAANFKLAKEARVLGKKTNFTTEYGAAADKLAQTLLVSKEEAQAYIDAKEAAFPGAAQWKVEVVEEAQQFGYVQTMLGARRHLAPLLNSSDRWVSSKADRQAVNYKVQSSSAEMTKLAEGRMWKADLAGRFDCEIIGPVHDEVLASCAVTDLYDFIPAMHACMVAKYAAMGLEVRSSISFGPNFSKQIEIGELPTAEAISEGILELSEA